MTTALGADDIELPCVRVGGMLEDSLTKQDCNAKSKMHFEKESQQEKAKECKAKRIMVYIPIGN
jgi:hypothetical protein